MNQIPLYIMAGGQSSRFGSDKARAQLHGKPLLQHVATQLTPLATTITVVAQTHGQYDDLGYTTIADQQPLLGPMGGVQAALLHLLAQQVHTQQSDWCAVVSCDTPGLRSEWLQQLLNQLDTTHHAIAFGPSPWDPLFALYHTNLLPTIEACLHTGQRSLWRMLEANNTLALPHPPDWHTAPSINTEEELLSFGDELFTVLK